ncbi:C40 family peptidase [soil metagenome]
MKFIGKLVFVSVCVTFGAVCFTGSASAQVRDRVVKSSSSRPTNMPPAAAQPQPVQSGSDSRPVLTNRIVLITPEAANAPLVKKTGSSKPTNAPTTIIPASIAPPTNSSNKPSPIAPILKTTNVPTAFLAAGRTVYGTETSVRLDQSIKTLYGKPYRYGSTGPNSYDCSGFVWKAFQDAGIGFTRASARSLWAQSEPVYGDDRFRYGTLVFFNNLGHMGIVADEKGFYQASSSKGITYSPFEGYWQGRIVGFRRLKVESTLQPPVSSPVVER